MFDVRTEAEGDKSPAVAVDILQAPACPQFDQVAQITYDATATACQLDPQTGSPKGNPCAVKVDGAVATSIANHVASMSSSLVAASATVAATSTSTGGVGAARTVQTALAAACVLCGLAFS